MAETSPPCRWGPVRAVNVLVRLRNKITQKFFVSRLLSDFDSSGLIPNPNSDAAMDGTYECGHQFQNPSAPQLAPGYGQISLPWNCSQVVGIYTQDGDEFPQTQQDGGSGDELMLFDFPAETESQDREDYFRLQDFEDDERDDGGTSFAPPLPLSDDVAFECRCGYCLSCQILLMDITPGNSSTQLVPALGHHMMGLPRWSLRWGVVRGFFCSYRTITALLRTNRLLRTMSTPTTPRTPRMIRSGDGRSLRYRGVRQRNGKWVSEMRIAGTLEKVWLGSYNIEKEAALAFDAGKHHCSGATLRKVKGFNFFDSPRLLGTPESLHHLSSMERRNRVKVLAEDYARTYSSVNIR